MVLLRHSYYSDLHFKLFIQELGSHILFDVSGLCLKAIKQFAREVFIDNGVFHLIKTRKNLNVKELVKYGHKNLKRAISYLPSKDYENVYIVIPDYPYSAEVNKRVYEVFIKEYGLYYKGLGCKFVYVLHGYWNTVIDGVNVDLLAIPFNTLTTIPIRELEFKKCWKLDALTLKYIVTRTVEYAREFGYQKIHLLGTTAKTLRKLFGPVKSKIELMDGTTISDDFFKYIVSFDTSSYHYNQDSNTDGYYLIQRHDFNTVKEFFMKWIKNQPFTIIEW